MMNKKGALVLRDIVFMMMIVSSLFVLSGLYVSEMASNYENTNMSNEWSSKQTNVLGNSTFYKVGQNITDTGDGLSTDSTGILSLITGGLAGLGKALFMVLFAPTTIANLIGGTLEDVGVNTIVSTIITYLIQIILWGIIIFTIISSFLRGGKL